MLSSPTSLPDAHPVWAHLAHSHLPSLPWVIPAGLSWPKTPGAPPSATWLLLGPVCPTLGSQGGAGPGCQHTASRRRGSWPHLPTTHTSALSLDSSGVANGLCPWASRWTMVGCSAGLRKVLRLRLGCRGRQKAEGQSLPDLHLLQSLPRAPEPGGHFCLQKDWPPERGEAARASSPGREVTGRWPEALTPDGPLCEADSASLDFYLRFFSLGL